MDVHKQIYGEMSCNTSQGKHLMDILSEKNTTDNVYHMKQAHTVEEFSNENI